MGQGLGKKGTGSYSRLYTYFQVLFLCPPHGRNTHAECCTIAAFCETVWCVVGCRGSRLDEPLYFCLPGQGVSLLVCPCRIKEGAAGITVEVCFGVPDSAGEKEKAKEEFPCDGIHGYV